MLNILMLSSVHSCKSYAKMDVSLTLKTYSTEGILCLYWLDF